MPLYLDETGDEGKINKVANKLVDMIEAGGGEVIQENQTYEIIWNDKTETHKCFRGHWDWINLTYPDSKLRIRIEMYLDDCECESDYDKCECDTTLYIYIDLLDDRLWEEEEEYLSYEFDSTNFDYSRVVNSIIERMS